MSFTKNSYIYTCFIAEEGNDPGLGTSISRKLYIWFREEWHIFMS